MTPSPNPNYPPSPSLAHALLKMIDPDPNPKKVIKLRSMGAVSIKDRIDYELQMGALDLSVLSESMASLTAHNCYWSNIQVFRFLVFVLQVGRSITQNFSA